jgi:heat-inducible transcriptional repressor
MHEPEFADVEKMRAIFVAFEETSKLVRVLDHCLAQQGLTLIIGSENALREWQGLSLVTAPYYSGEQLLGTLGVIGPTRMEYDKIVPLVDFTARLVSRSLTAAAS